MNQIKLIEFEIQNLKNKLTTHKLYSLLSNVDDIRIFMETHVYAVWDFMSLLKSLQTHLTCTSIPWKPVENAKISRFINEIILGEESDLNEKGIPKSHFEMYLDAMKEVNADTNKILTLVNQIDKLETVSSIVDQSTLNLAEKSFLKFTFEIIKTGEPHKIASAFTFGREDLIPDMFIEIINKSNDKHQKTFPKLTYYLNRHIELDGDEHGPLSLELIKELCGNNNKKWAEVLEVAKAALTERINLWDSIASKIEKEEPTHNNVHTLI